MIFISYLFIANVYAESPSGAFENARMREKIEETRASISEAERKQRESLSNLFVINKSIRDIAKKNAKLNEKMLAQEAKVRDAAQEFREMEERSERHRMNLNHRLRQLYQGRNQDTIHWIFSAKSPAEFDRNHRFLKRMVDADHKQLKTYLAQLKDLRRKREQLKGLVASLSRMQKEIRAEEARLSAQMKQKSKYNAELRRMKDIKLSELKDLRGHLPAEGDFAFFERKGTLKPPVDAAIKREYGTYVDPQFRFRLMHKGLFFAAEPSSPVTCIADGTVVLAGRLPGYGKSVIVDHGDNYYSVYAFTSQLKVKEGAKIKEGETLALAGGASPLFGPGLYFEIRHFTDAIDPRRWIKEPIIKTAKRSTSWDDVSGIAGP